MQAGQEERSLGTLFSDLAQQLGELLRQEVNLAKSEMTQKATQASKQIGYIAIGGAVAYIGLMAIIAALIIGLGHAIPMWLSALLIGVLVAAGGYAGIQRGITELKKTNVAPQQTIDTLKEDASWIREQAS